LKFLIEQEEHYPHAISDLSGEEDKVDPGKVMRELWDRINANVEYYMEVNKKEYI
jgi:hypothetical protein